MRADQVLQLLEHEGSSEEDVRQLLRRGGHIFNGILEPKYPVPDANKAKQYVREIGEQAARLTALLKDSLHLEESEAYCIFQDYCLRVSETYANPREVLSKRSLAVQFQDMVELYYRQRGCLLKIVLQLLRVRRAANERLYLEEAMTCVNELLDANLVDKLLARLLQTEEKGGAATRQPRYSASQLEDTLRCASDDATSIIATLMARWAESTVVELSQVQRTLLVLIDVDRVTVKPQVLHRLLRTAQALRFGVPSSLHRHLPNDASTNKLLTDVSYGWTLLIVASLGLAAWGPRREEPVLDLSGADAKSVLDPLEMVFAEYLPTAQAKFSKGVCGPEAVAVLAWSIFLSLCQDNPALRGWVGDRPARYSTDSNKYGAFRYLQALTTAVTGPLKLPLHRDDEHLPPDSDVVMSVVEGLMLQVAALRFLPPLRDGAAPEPTDVISRLIARPDDLEALLDLLSHAYRKSEHLPLLFWMQWKEDVDLEDPVSGFRSQHPLVRMVAMLRHCLPLLGASYFTLLAALVQDDEAAELLVVLLSCPTRPLTMNSVQELQSTGGSGSLVRLSNSQTHRYTEFFASDPWRFDQGVVLGTGAQGGVNVACVQWITPVNFWAFLFGCIREMALVLPRSRRRDGQDKLLPVGVAALQLLGSVLSANRASAINLSALLAQDWANRALQVHAHRLSPNALDALTDIVADENFTAHSAVIEHVIGHLQQLGEHVPEEVVRAVLFEIKTAEAELGNLPQELFSSLLQAVITSLGQVGASQRVGRRGMDASQPNHDEFIAEVASSVFVLVSAALHCQPPWSTAAMQALLACEAGSPASGSGAGLIDALIDAATKYEASIFHTRLLWFDRAHVGNYDVSLSACRMTLSALLRLFQPSVRSDLRELFQVFDRDGSETLTRDEFARGLAQLGYRLSHRAVDSLFEMIDTDGTNTIEYDEFLQFALSAQGNESMFGSAASANGGGGGESNAAAELQAFMRTLLQDSLSADPRVKPLATNLVNHALHIVISAGSWRFETHGQRWQLEAAAMHIIHRALHAQPPDMGGSTSSFVHPLAGFREGLLEYLVSDVHVLGSILQTATTMPTASVRTYVASVSEEHRPTVRKMKELLDAPDALSAHLDSFEQRPLLPINFSSSEMLMAADARDLQSFEQLTVLGLQIVYFLLRHSIAQAKHMLGPLLEAVAARADGVSTQYQELSLKTFSVNFTYVLAFASYVDYTQTISHGPTDRDVQLVVTSLRLLQSIVNGEHVHAGLTAATAPADDTQQQLKRVRTSQRRRFTLVEFLQQENTPSFCRSLCTIIENLDLVEQAVAVFDFLLEVLKHQSGFLSNLFRVCRKSGSPGLHFADELKDSLLVKSICELLRKHAELPPRVLRKLLEFLLAMFGHCGASSLGNVIFFIATTSTVLWDCVTSVLQQDLPSSPPFLPGLPTQPDAAVDMRPAGGDTDTESDDNELSIADFTDTVYIHALALRILTEERYGALDRSAQAAGGRDARAPENRTVNGFLQRAGSESRVNVWMKNYMRLDFNDEIVRLADKAATTLSITLTAFEHAEGEKAAYPGDDYFYNMRLLESSFGGKPGSGSSYEFSSDDGESIASKSMTAMSSRDLMALVAAVNRMYSVSDAQTVLMRAWRCFMEVTVLVHHDDDASGDVPSSPMASPLAQLSPRKAPTKSAIPVSPTMRPSDFSGQTRSYYSCQLIAGMLAEETRSGARVAAAVLEMTELLVSMLHHQMHRVVHKDVDPSRSEVAVRQTHRLTPEKCCVLLEHLHTAFNALSQNLAATNTYGHVAHQQLQERQQFARTAASIQLNLLVSSLLLHRELLRQSVAPDSRWFKDWATLRLKLFHQGTTVFRRCLQLLQETDYALLDTAAKPKDSAGAGDAEPQPKSSDDAVILHLLSVAIAYLRALLPSDRKTLSESLAVAWQEQIAATGLIRMSVELFDDLCKISAKDVAEVHTYGLPTMFSRRGERAHLSGGKSHLQISLLLPLAEMLAHASLLPLSVNALLEQRVVARLCENQLLRTLQDTLVEGGVQAGYLFGYSARDGEMSPYIRCWQLVVRMVSALVRSVFPAAGRYDEHAGGNAAFALSPDDVQVFSRDLFGFLEVYSWLALLPMRATRLTLVQLELAATTSSMLSEVIRRVAYWRAVAPQLAMELQTTLVVLVRDYSVILGDARDHQHGMKHFQILQATTVPVASAERKEEAQLRARGRWRNAMRMVVLILWIVRHLHEKSKQKKAVIANKSKSKQQGSLLRNLFSSRDVPNPRFHRHSHSFGGRRRDSFSDGISSPQQAVPGSRELHAAPELSLDDVVRERGGLHRTSSFALSELSSVEVAPQKTNNVFYQRIERAICKVLVPALSILRRAIDPNLRAIPFTPEEIVQVTLKPGDGVFVMLGATDAEKAKVISQSSDGAVLMQVLSTGQELWVPVTAICAVEDAAAQRPLFSLVPLPSFQYPPSEQAIRALTPLATPGQPATVAHLILLLLQYVCTQRARLVVAASAEFGWLGDSELEDFRADVDLLVELVAYICATTLRQHRTFSPTEYNSVEDYVDTLHSMLRRLRRASTSRTALYSETLNQLIQGLMTLLGVDTEPHGAHPMLDRGPSSFERPALTLTKMARQQWWVTQNGSPRPRAASIGTPDSVNATMLHHQYPVTPTRFDRSLLTEQID